jgi:hypothetical protein
MKAALIALLGLTLAGGTLHAQAPAAVQPQGGRQTAPEPARQGGALESAQPAPLGPAAMAVNVRVDVAIIDTRDGEAKREQVTVTSADREAAYSRAGGNGALTGLYVLNVDAVPFVSGMPTGKVRVRLSLDYVPVKPPGVNVNTGGVARTQLQFSLVLDDGEMMVASDTTDPASDRRVRVEVTATILK